MSACIDRRSFVKGAGAAAGAAALAAAAGTAQADEAEGWDEEYDIVIVGAGGAGYIAAIEAAATDPDATIHIIEKMDIVGGSSVMSGGNIGAIFTDVQEEAAKDNPFFADDSLDLYFEDKMATGDFQSDPDLVRLYVDNAHDNYEWLKSFGISWTRMGIYEQPAYLPSDPSVASVQGASVYLQTYDEDGCFAGLNHKGRWVCGPVYGDFHNGPAVMAALEDQVANNCPNVDVACGVALKSIVREGVVEGNVTGVVVDEAGAEKRIKADRAVILACGGFAANPEMLHMYNGKIDLSVKPSGGTGNTGDGLVAAGFIGAQTVNMGSIQIDHGYNVNASGLFSTKASNPFGNPSTYINLDAEGKRFWGEMAGAAQYSDAKLSRLNTLHMVNYWTLGDATSVATGGATEDDLKSFEQIGYVADSVEEMAEKLGCDAATLQATLDAYNSFVDAGVDTDFGKAAFYLTQRIETAPFYAFETCYTCRSTPGGLRISTSCEVLDLNGEPIPHLYAAGEVTGNVHGHYRNTGGDSWTDLACFGRIAGASAAKVEPVA